VNLRQMLFLRHLSKKELPMLKTLFATGQWVNAVVLVMNVLNSMTQTFPALEGNKYILAIQAAVGILLPSLGGFAHKAAFGEVQDPTARK